MFLKSSKGAGQRVCKRRNVQTSERYGLLSSVFSKDEKSHNDIISSLQM